MGPSVFPVVQSQSAAICNPNLQFSRMEPRKRAATSTNETAIMTGLRSTCDTCLRMKIKCDKEKPSCWSCVRKGYRCNYSAKRKPGRKVPRDDNESEVQTRNGPPQEVGSLEARTPDPQHLSSIVMPGVEGFGFQEMGFLNHYYRTFNKQFPAAAEPGVLQRTASALRRTTVLTASDQADLVGLWSSVALGAFMSGNRQDFGAYMQRVQLASDAGGLIAGGRAEVTARCRLALLGDVLGQTTHAYTVLDECGPLAAQLGDSGALATLKVLHAFFGGADQKSLSIFFDLVARGAQSFLEPDEAPHAQLAMRVFYEVAYLLFRMPFFFGEARADVEAAVRGCHANLELAAAEMAARPEAYNPMAVFVVEECAWLLEVAFLQQIGASVDRARGKLAPLLRAHPYVVHISYINQRVESLLYAFWLLKERGLYEEVAAVWNAQVYMNPARLRPFPPFEEYSPESQQCDHFRCQMINPKLKLAIGMFLSSFSPSTSPSDGATTTPPSSAQMPQPDQKTIWDMDEYAETLRHGYQKSAISTTWQNSSADGGNAGLGGGSQQS